MKKGNQGDGGGRPVLYDSVEEMQKIIDEYFEWCDNRTKTIYDDKTGSEVVITHPAPYTMSGLARRLGMSRRTLVDYAKKDKFLPTIKAARERVHEDVENRLMETRNQTGAIFNLKNNFGWVDKNETDLTSNGEKITGPVIYVPEEKSVK
nr:hypothetical protein 3 [Gammaproteobacteria bacterium]